MLIGELFLGAFLQVAFDRIFPREIKEFIRRVKVDADLTKLKRKMLTIQGVLHDAEQKQIANPAVREWLDQLTHMAYDMDDLCDEIATDAARLRLEEECSRPDTNQVLQIPYSKFLDFWSKSKESGKIKELIVRFDELVEQRHDLGLMISQGVGDQGSSIGLVSRQRPPTTYLPLDSHVYGREKDADHLLKLLLSDDNDETGDHNDKVSVIPIVGMGGVGKTTLAQHLYNHKEVSKRFNLKLWVCVSDAKFDLIRVTKDILESATKESFTLQGLQQLQERLKNILSDKFFLLVLDDVWSEDYNDWDCLRAPFKYGPRGSKIIVTTRSKNVSSMMRTVPSYPLRELSEEDCQSVFNQHAYENGSPDAHPELKPIGEKIVKQCKGLPLAAKTLGGLLRCKLHTSEWEDILNSKIWDLSEDKSGILPSLRLSYHYLPAHLKRCFSYCAIFPQDYVFDKKKLVLLWMAEGFLQPHQRTKRMEDLGNEYFHDLLSRSFFQQSSSNGYVMHDLIHDLAQSVSKGICFCFKDGLLEVDELSEVDKSLVRYTLARLHDYNVMARFESFHESKSLRTLLLISSSSFARLYIPKKTPQYLISKLPCLRVLCFGNCINVYELPESIGNLKHLRYIDLSGTSIERLPSSVSTLLNLQTLILSNCNKLVELLSDMGNLTNLRHLYIDGCNNLREMPLGINKLTNLQTLPMFVVGKNSWSRIEELIDMKQLRDKKLSILRLKNADNICGAILGNKEHIDELNLNWSFPYDKSSEREDTDSGDGSREVAIINELQPHTNLKRITVSWYNGTRFPDWLGYSSYSNLVNLELIDCRRCQFLPPLGCLPSLKYLQIKGLWSVKKVGSEFYGGGVPIYTSKPPFQSLERLVFKDMRDWDEWSGIVEEREEEFPSLCQLEIMNCPKLRKFSHCFVKLEELRIQQCGELTALPMCLPMLSKLHIMECNEMVLRSVADSPPPSLTSLNISKISNLENIMLPLEGGGGGRSLLRPLTAVKELHDYESVESIRRSLSYEIERVSQLRACFRSLDISECPQLVCLSDDEDVLSLTFSTSSCQNLHFFKFPSGIERLSIHNCPSFVSFPAKMELPSTLRSLEIFHCDNLKIFPEIVMRNGNKDSIFLDILWIDNCDSLTSFTSSGSSSGGLPLLLKHLIIRNCQNLVSPPEVMIYNNQFLESLIIERCDKITSFSSSGRCLGGFNPYIVLADNMNDDLPSSSQVKSGMMNSVLPTTITNVKQILIKMCKNLNSLPDSLYKLTSLRYLEILECPNLVSFPDGGLPTTALSDFIIYSCKKLRFLPDGLHNVTSLINLEILKCPNLDPFPEGGLPSNLKFLEVNCGGQKRMAEWGLRNLTSLDRLTIGGFPGLVVFSEHLLPSNLTDLFIQHLPDLQFLSEGLRNLACLRYLSIRDCNELESFPEKWLPSSLQKLTIHRCNKLASFSEKGLPSSLKYLRINKCDKLASFPEKWLPSSLQQLSISNCPLLKEWFDTEKGKDWIETSDIPCLEMDGIRG